MNVGTISREKIIEKSQKIIIENGVNAISIRKVAAECNVSIGTVYNYFDSKDEFLIAVIESTWKNIFHMPNGPMKFASFSECVDFVFARLQKGVVEYENFFDLHSLSAAIGKNGEGIKVIEKYFKHMEDNMLKVLENDRNIRSDAFNENFKIEKFVDIVFGMLLNSLLHKVDNRLEVVEIVNRCLY